MILPNIKKGDNKKKSLGIILICFKILLPFKIDEKRMEKLKAEQKMMNKDHQARSIFMHFS